MKILEREGTWMVQFERLAFATRSCTSMYLIVRAAYLDKFKQFEFRCLQKGPQTKQDWEYSVVRYV